MIQTDCFAFRKEKLECNALNNLYCKNEECRFYKNRDEYIKEKCKKED